MNVRDIMLPLQWHNGYGSPLVCDVAVSEGGGGVL